MRTHLIISAQANYQTGEKVRPKVTNVSMPAQEANQ